MADYSMMKLGKNAPRVDKRSLRMSTYLTNDIPAPPVEIDYTGGVKSWGVMKNKDLGCCTIAGCGHQEQVWQLNCGKGLINIDDATIIKYYSDWDGYVVGDDSTDNGGIELDVLNSWRNNGFDGHPLTAYAVVNPLNQVHVKQGIVLFGGIYIGLELPLTCQDQVIWDVKQVNDGTDAPESWGGHCVCVPGYTTQGPFCITWGEIKQMTWAFWVKYCSEAYSLLSPDWLKSGMAPSGYNQDQLMSDLKVITR